MTAFWLVRHGAYELLDYALGGRADYPLNEEGRAQADRAAEWVASRGVTAVLSSPVQRARETAEPIAAAAKLQTVLEPGLAEIDFAAWQGASFADLAQQTAWQRWNQCRGVAGVPGGETMLAAQARAVAACARAAVALPQGEVVMVSHADIIKAILAHVLGSPLDLIRRIDIAPGSISRISFSEGDARVLAVNLCPSY